MGTKKDASFSRGHNSLPSRMQRMIPSELIVDEDAFSILSAECEIIIDTQKRLPDFVFRRTFARYFAIEYCHIFAKEFAAFLFQMSNIFSDASVNYMTLNPSPADKGYRQRSYFGLASFRSSSLAERYIPVLSWDRNTPQLLTSVNVGAFWGSSLRWAVSCDRISWELVVIAVAENVDVPKISGFRCFTASEISSYMKSQYHWKLPTALDFNERFLANYPL
jgi:hypothetical protein